MAEARLPAAAVGNGRLLVTIDAQGEPLSACWPCIDSPNQMPIFHTTSIVSDEASLLTKGQFKPGMGYINDTNIFQATTTDGLLIQDTVIDVDISLDGKDQGLVDSHVRRIGGPHAALTIHIVPELDGRAGAQTVYWDEELQALMAFCRHNWVAIGSGRGQAVDFHCGRRGDESAAAHFVAEASFPGERLAFRTVDAVMRLKPSEKETLVFAVYAESREKVISGLHSARSYSWEQVEQITNAKSQQFLGEMTLKSGSESVNRALRRSCLVLDLLTNRNTGGIIAGPDVQSGIESAPGYAAVWGRDAAWTVLGALALGRSSNAKQMLRFAIRTQAPEGLWLQRHHTDYSLASSWGMHQVDETGILLHAIACYVKVTQDMAFVEESWPTVMKAANFLEEALDEKLGLSIQSVDIWEEREGFHAYTSASSAAGLRAAAILGTRLKEHDLADRWSKAADILSQRTVSQFWNESEGRFVSSLHLSAALPMLDSERPELSATVQHGQRPATALPQYPNWRDSKSVEVSLRHDIAVLALTLPFELLQLEDSRIRATIIGLREKLWNSKVGGMERYEGDSYGGGNPWPLATLWLAIYEGARGNTEDAASLIDWVVSHSTAADLVPEQVHRTLGHPVAAVPLSWSHAMISIAVAALQGRQVWSLSGGL